MAGGRRQNPPPLNGGDSLFQLVQTHQHPSQFPPFTPPPFRPHSAAFDPAVGPIFHLPINAPGQPLFPPPSATGASFFPLCPPNFFVHGGHGFFHHLRSPPLPPSPGFADPQFVYHRQRSQEHGKLTDGGKTLLVGDDPDGISEKKKHRGKEFRSDPRGIQTLSQSMRNWKRLVQCRVDIERFNSPLVEIYESLIPAEEEKGKQKNLLARLEKLVCKEWPNARLHLYGSCANSFAFSGSDLDVCLQTDDQGVNKPEVLLKLAELLLSNNLENVRALTHARVPIVKLKDPDTGLSCDISINNVFAVENTKLIQDYAQIDDRLFQLVFIVKHWAKRRGINEAYMGTLPSYAYVLMCIHFLQQRKPAILPCLQGMNATYTVTVDNINIAYFDQVERLKNYGSSSTESLAQLVWGFFHYWAYCHDYTSSVISVRTGSILSKQAKGWTRRVGNDRHLMCIEDPFETSNDVGRVVDRRSIWVIREEFERAAQVLQDHPDPCVELFEPYAPP